MNPPFTDFRRLPQLERDNLIIKFGSSQYNYWAYFLLVSFNWIKNNGTIAAVLPDGFFRGGDTSKIRSTLIKDGIKIEYVIKSTVEVAFSERASFRDYLVILRKDEQLNDNYMYTILINKKLSDFSEESAYEISKQILKARLDLQKKNKLYYKDDIFTCIKIPYSMILNHIDNCYVPVSFLTEEMYLGFFEILKYLEESDKIEKLIYSEKKKILSIRRYNPGEYTHPNKEIWTKSKEIARQLFLAKNKKERGKWVFELDKDTSFESDRLFLLMRKSNTKRPTGFYVPRKSVVKAIRTYTGMKNMDITRSSSYVLIDPYVIPEFIRNLLGWDQTPLEAAKNDILEAYDNIAGYLVFVHKVRIPSPSLYWVSFYSDTPILSSSICVKIINKNIAKALTLWNNSVLGILQLLSMRSEISEAWSAFDKESVWGQLLAPNFEKFNEKELEPLVKTFDQIGKSEALLLNQRFESKDKLQFQIDKSILKFIGLDKQIPKLSSIYNAISQEFSSSKIISSTNS